VAVSPLTLTSRELPPPNMPWRPATGPAGRLRDAALRGVVGLATRTMLDPQMNRLRAEFGLRPAPPGRLFDSTYSTDLVLAQGEPGLEFSRTDLPSSVRFVGRLAAPVAAGSAAELPPWWPDLAAARRVVHVTQGTLDTAPDDLLKPTLAALADQDVLVVCTTGGADPAVLGTLPANARAAAFVPHDLLLPEVDVMVTNGGWGGVLAALQAGVPLVVAGGSLDKPEVARRVAWSGAGIDLRTGSPKPARIAAAVREILDRPAFASRAQEIGMSLTAAGGPARAGDLLDALLAR
jgi:UDP:flavonoid glycosyltransferase YjiC (YdhE family)